MGGKGEGIRYKPRATCTILQHVRSEGIALTPSSKEYGKMMISKVLSSRGSLAEFASIFINILIKKYDRGEIFMNFL